MRESFKISVQLENCWNFSFYNYPDPDFPYAKIYIYKKIYQNFTSLPLVQIYRTDIYKKPRLIFSRVQNNYVDQHNVHFPASNFTNTNPRMLENPDNQIVPFPWRKGMWASVLLVAFLVAGTKIYFDHRTTNMEILIFCAFASTFALAACTVTICRFPKNTNMTTIRNLPQTQTRNATTTTTNPTSTTISELHSQTHHYQQQQQHQQQLHQQQQQLQAHQLNHSLPAIVGTSSAPPPYHIAILLPEENKDLPQDESPPPSYDKILI